MLPAAQQKIFKKLLSRPDNLKCADCNSKSPSWASIDFGVFVCLNCSGAHRALGPSVTRVRSTQLDSWNKQWTELLVIGNQQCNKYWEFNLNSFKKPTGNSSLEEIKKYVVEKYIKRKFVPQNQSDPVTLLKLQRSKNQQFKQILSQKQRSENVQEDIEIISVKTIPDYDLLSFEDFDNDTTKKPEMKIPQTKKQVAHQNQFIDAKKEINLLNFQEISQKKNHSLDFHSVSHPQHFHLNSHYANQTIYQPPINQYSYQMYNTNNFHNFNTNNGYSNYPSHQNFYPQQNQNIYNYKANNLSTNYHQNVMHHQHQQQPFTMNMHINMNMYANNLNINIKSQPVKQKNSQSSLLNNFDQFRF